MTKEDSDKVRVVIAGAGIAGLAAAQVLIDAGLTVTVFEKSRGPGGRCFSYVDRELGYTIEHGVHGVFPRYVNLRRLWREAGIAESVFCQTRTTGMAGPGRVMAATELARGRGPAPLFLMRMLPKGVLRWRDLCFALPFLLRTYASRWKHTRALDETTFGAMLRSSGVSGRMASLLLVPYIKNLTYARGDEVSALVASQALNYYVVEHADSVKASWIDGGPSARIFEPWQRELERRGVRFVFRQPVEAVLMDGDRFVGFGAQAAIAERDLGAEPKLWTQQIGHRNLALNWQPAGRTLRAFDAACTHQGCPVVARNGGDKPLFHCPCHGAQFDAEGKVLRAPATTPLREVPLRHDGAAGVWMVEPEGERAPASQSAVAAAEYAVIALDLGSLQKVLPRALANNASTADIPLLRTTSVMVLRLNFAARASKPRWSGPDSGVFAAEDVLDNFFALHTFQEEFRVREELVLECHIGDSEKLQGLSDSDVYERSLEVLEHYFPKDDLRARFDLDKSRLLRHEAAFPLFAPGDYSRMPQVSDARRPNLMLAGDWVRTDDPEHRSFFMERAAVTGIEAANAILRSVGLSERQKAIESPVSPWVSRCLSWPSRALGTARAGFRRLLGVSYD